MRPWLSSVTRLGAALSTLAVEQLAGGVDSNSRGRSHRGPAAVLDALAETAASQLGDASEVIHHAGVELAEDFMARPRPQGGGLRRSLDAAAVFFGDDARAQLVRREAGAKAKVYWKVRRARAVRAAVDKRRPFALAPALELAVVDDPVLSFFALEGLAHDYVKARLEVGGQAPRGLFELPVVARLNAGACTALHAGLGLAAAEFVLGSLTSRSGARCFDDGVSRFLDLCRDNVAGEAGHEVAMEVLGLVTTVFYPGLCAGVESALRERPLPRRLYWHGAGRGSYFSGGQLVPGYGSLRRAVERVSARAPAGPLADAAYCGVGYALTMVNTGQPDVVAGALLDGDYSPEAIRGLSTGLVGALTMRRLLGDGGDVHAFLEACSVRLPRDLFQVLVAGPLEALEAAGRRHTVYGSLPWGQN